MVEEIIVLKENFSQSHMKQLMSVDVDFLGSMLKVVAGTPDTSNLESSRFLEARLIDANNR